LQGKPLLIPTKRELAWLGSASRLSLVSVYPSHLRSAQRRRRFVAGEQNRKKY
jgi:hypothetical protein